MKRTSAEAKLGKLAARYEFDEVAQGRLAALVTHLDDAAAPSTVHGAGTIVDRHLADALVALELPYVAAAERVADLGAGAGVPALPLAVALPQAQFAAVEATGRKCGFIREGVEALGLEKVDVVPRRAEEWAEGLGVHDLVCARALARLGVLLEYSAPLLAIGGRLVAWKGAVDSDERREADVAAAELGMVFHVEHHVKPFRGAEQRRLVVYEKQTETPARFPRRAGVATKRPLGADRSRRSSAESA